VNPGDEETSRVLGLVSSRTFTHMFFESPIAST
jgi:hypothetical protein